MTGSIPDRLEKLLTGCVSELGLDLEELELTPAGKRRVLRVAVDQDDGVNINDIARATNAISALLDSTNVMGSLPYTLEVGSRGAGRPLLQPRHWRRNHDRQVLAHLVDGTTIEGRIAASDDSSVNLTTAAGNVTLAYRDIDKALVQFELNRKGV